MKGRREPFTSRLRGMGVARNRAAGDSEPAHKVRDEELVRALYAEHAAALLRFTLRMTDGDRQRAEDIVQETLLRAWLHPEAIAERPARPWLFAWSSCSTRQLLPSACDGQFSTLMPAAPCWSGRRRCRSAPGRC